MRGRMKRALAWIVYVWDVFDYKLIGTNRNRVFPPRRPS